MASHALLPLASNAIDERSIADFTTTIDASEVDTYAQSLAQRTEDSARRQYVEWLLSFPSIELVPLDSERRPVMCQIEHHAACQQFAHGCNSGTRDVEALCTVLKAHPEKTLGVVPDESLLIIDFDSEDAIRQFVDHAPIDFNEHLVIGTPRGLHLYVHMDPTSESILASRKGIDLRYNRNGLVAAPGTLRPDGGYYEIISGTWGDAGWDHRIVDYFTVESHVPIAGNGTARGGRSARKVAIDKMRALERRRAAHPKGDEHSPVEAHRIDFSESADLCSVWMYCYWAGVSSDEAVDIVLKERPKNIANRLRDRDRKWLINDAARVFRKVSSGRGGRPQFDAAPTRKRLTTTFGADHQLLQVFDFIVNKINRTLDPDISIGLQELADHFGRSKSAAKKWVDRLIEEGTLQVIKGHFFTSDPSQGHKNRVRVFNVVGLQHLHIDTSARWKDHASTSDKSELPQSPSVPTSARHLRVVRSVATVDAGSRVSRPVEPETHEQPDITTQIPAQIDEPDDLNPFGATIAPVVRRFMEILDFDTPLTDWSIDCALAGESWSKRQQMDPEKITALVRRNPRNNQRQWNDSITKLAAFARQLAGESAFGVGIALEITLAAIEEQLYFEAIEARDCA